MATRKERLIEVAYHEAGHAVVAAARGIEIEGIVVHENGSGECIVEPMAFVHKNIERLSEASGCVIAYYLAGGISQKKYLEAAGIASSKESILNQCADDQEKAQSILEICEQNGTELSPEVIIEQVQNLLNEPEVWSKVEELAAAITGNYQMNREDVAPFLAPIFGKYE